MNAVVAAPVDQAAVRKALFDELGLSMIATFVPFSQSRSAKPKPAVTDLNLNWRVSLLRKEQIVLSTDYSAGIGHIPGYKHTQKSMSVDAYNTLVCICESGNNSWENTGRMKHNKIPNPTIDDVLYSLVMDSAAIDYPNFESWASDFGYETDSRAAEAIYKACLDTGLRLRAAVGSKGLARLQEVFQDY